MGDTGLVILIGLVTLGSGLIMRKSLVGALAAAPLLFATAVGAQSTSFDSVPDGTDLATHMGMKFTCEGTCPDQGVFARTTPGAPSSPNTITPVKTAPGVGVHNPTTGVIKVELACAASSATIKAKSIQTPEALIKQYAQITAFGVNNAKVDEKRGAVYGQFETLTVSSPSLMSKLQLAVQDNGAAAVAQFDDLSVECAPVVARWYWLLLFGILLITATIIWWVRRPPPPPPPR